MSNNEVTGPLAGCLVVAVEQAVAAPYCTSRLADAGARVIKVEREGGDFARHYDTAADGHSAYFVWLNRGKESVCLDLKRAPDLELLRKIIAQADVFVQNLAPGATQRLGLDSASLSQKNERLITVDISGYGESGPYANMKAYDLLVQCESGLAMLTGSVDAPGRVGVSVCDIACGMYAYSGVLEALLRRAQTGQGSALSVSLFSAIADWMCVPLLQAEGGMQVGRAGLNHPTIAPYGAYPLADGQLVVFSIQNQREWERLCSEVLGQPELISDPRFVDNTKRVAHRPELDQCLIEVLASAPPATVLQRFSAADLAFARVRDLDQLGAHPALHRIPQPVADGQVLAVAPPVTVDGQPTEAYAAVPSAGQHTDAIWTEFSG